MELKTLIRIKKDFIFELKSIARNNNQIYEENTIERCTLDFYESVSVALDGLQHCEDTNSKIEMLLDSFAHFTMYGTTNSVMFDVHLILLKLKLNFCDIK